MTIKGDFQANERYEREREREYIRVEKKFLCVWCGKVQGCKIRTMLKKRVRVGAAVKTETFIAQCGARVMHVIQEARGF